jgi:PKD repeat protein
MVLRNHIVLVSLLVAVAIMVGCQGNGTPVVPGSQDNPAPSPALSQGSLNHAPAGVVNTHHLLAFVDVKIDAQKQKVEFTQLRTASQHLNLLEVIPLYCKPVTSCLDFINLVIDMPTATCDLDVVVKHPIPDAYADCYDLRGIGIFKGTLAPGFTNGSVATQMLNADGFTTAYDMAGDFDAFLNPYKAFNKDLPRRIFAHSTETTEHLTVKFPSLDPSDATFQYAVDASWADPNLINPGDLTTDPNIPEPYQVNVLYTDPVKNEMFAEGTAVVEIFDWQKNATGVTFEIPNLLGGSFDMAQVLESNGRYLFYYNVSNQENPAPGTYPFLAKATDQYLSQPDLGNPTITVNLTNYQLGYMTVYDGTSNTAPVASIVADDLTIKTGGTVHFDASGSSDAEDTTVASYAWDLDGDGLFNDGTDPQAEHQYSQAGKFAVNVLVTDSDGLTDILNLPLIVDATETVNTPPIAAAFASNIHPNVGQLITLDASGSTDEEDGKPVSWEWDLDGDGDYNDKSGEVIQTSWSTGGPVSVDVKVTDSGGLSDTLDTKILITVLEGPNTPPVAVAMADKLTAVVGELIIFDGTDSYDPEDGPVSGFAWDFLGAGTYTDSFSPVVPYKFWAPGTYLVDLRVTDSGGLTDTLDVPLSIEITGPPNQPPVAVAKVDKTLAHVGEMIHFDATDSYDPEEGTVKSYLWDLNGDGLYNDQFTGQFDYAYPAVGIYHVDVRVSDTPGLTDTLGTKITIQILAADNSAPVAIAHASKVFGYVGDTISFDGSDSYDPEDGSPTSWGWEFDGDDDYNDSPFIVAQYTYDTAGDYTVDLKVTDKNGAFDTLDVPISILIVPVGTNFPPEAVGEVDCAFPLIGQMVHFTDNSTDLDGTVVKWEWNWDDGTGYHDYTSTQGNITHAFSEEGINQVTLQVTDNLGATDVIDTPISMFVSAPTYVPPTTAPSCTGAMSHFYAASMPVSMPNTTETGRDMAFMSDGSYIMVVADKLFQLFVPAMMMSTPMLQGAGWVKSIDVGPGDLVALSGLTDGIIKVYNTVPGPSPTLSPLVDVNVGHPIEGICFDDTGNLQVYGGGILNTLKNPTYEVNGCGTYDVSEIIGYGTVNDMDFSVWNHSLYLAVNDGANGKVVEIDFLGKVNKVISDVLLGPSNYMDILTDRDVLDPSTAGCRIEVFGGSSQAYVTRLDAKLNKLDQSVYGFWGIRAAALNPKATNEVVVLEDCCVSWIDFLIPFHDWTDL